MDDLLFRYPTEILNKMINQKLLFKLSKIFESGLSDHHKFVSRSLKSDSFKGPPKIIGS